MRFDRRSHLSKSRSKNGRPNSLTNLGIGHVGLRVDDLKNSVRFYREILGLAIGSAEEGVARIHSGPDLIVLHGREYGSSDFHFGFRVNSPSEVDKWGEWFRSRNITVYQDVTEQKYRSIKIRDPDGYYVEITCDQR